MEPVRWLACLVVVGCGRIGLDPLSDAAAHTSDAALPLSCVTEADGTACDDGNICTVVSTCQGGACVGAGGSCEVAHSEADFSEVQGQLGWWYGCWDITDDVDGIYAPSDFQLMKDVSGVWRPADWAPDPDPHFTWAYLASWGGHPGSYPILRADIRRWVSTVSGAAIMRVTHRKSDTSGGDGTRAMLVVDGELRLMRDVAGDDGVGFVEDVPVMLHVGSTVDLLLHYVGDDAVDTTEQYLDIVSP
jgi:hypothetical protein